MTPSGYPPTGKGLGALIWLMKIPYELGYQVYLAYELAYERGNWKTGKQHNTGTEAGKQQGMETGKHGRREARKQGSREARKQGYREGRKQDSCETRKHGRMEARKQGGGKE